MTDSEFWRRVGEELQRIRMQRGMKSTHAVQTAGGPNYKTVAAIEAGVVGEFASLAQYLKVVDVSLVDLFRSVLHLQPESHGAELELVIRQFRSSGVKGRAAFVRLAELAEELQEQPSPGSTRDHDQTPRESKRANNATAKPRVKK